MLRTMLLAIMSARQSENISCCQHATFVMKVPSCWRRRATIEPDDLVGTFRPSRITSLSVIEADEQYSLRIPEIRTNISCAVASPGIARGAPILSRH